MDLANYATVTKWWITAMQMCLNHINDASQAGGYFGSSQVYFWGTMCCTLKI